MKFFFKFLRALPYGFLRIFLSMLGILLYFILSRRRKIGLKNIERALNLDNKKAKKILFRTYLYFAKMAAINIKYLGNMKFIKENVSIEGLEYYKEALSKNKGLMFTTAHFGNFEMLVCAFAMLERPINVMVRPLDNKSLNKIILDLRESCGNSIVSARLTVFDFIKRLQKGEMLGILADQYGGNKGLGVDFFGRAAKSSEGIAILSFKYKVPILPAYLKENGRKLTIVIQKPIYPTDEPFREAIYSIMRNIYIEFESWIKNDPTKYLWMHNRWKD